MQIQEQGNDVAPVIVASENDDSSIECIGDNKSFSDDVAMELAADGNHGLVDADYCIGFNHVDSAGDASVIFREQLKSQHNGGVGVGHVHSQMSQQVPSPLQEKMKTPLSQPTTGIKHFRNS